MNRFPQIIATLDPLVTAALRAGARAVEQEAKSRVPVATGRLRGAIHIEDHGDEIHVVAGGADTIYGYFVEFGTSSTPTRPFLVPALESRRGDIADEVKAALRKL